jgi:hypothetical protein
MSTFMLHAASVKMGSKPPSAPQQIGLQYETETSSDRPFADIRPSPSILQ